MRSTHLSVKHADRKDFEKLESFMTSCLFTSACDKTPKRFQVETDTEMALDLATR